MSKTKAERQKEAAESVEAVTELRELLKPGDTVYTILRAVSRSGSLRVIDPVIVTGEDGIRSIAALTAKALGMQQADGNDFGVRVSGSGMDMGFWLVYSLSRALFPDGFLCSDASHPHGCTMRDTDGGYALNHRWL